MAAWMLDEAVGGVILRLQNGDKLRPHKTTNNIDMLRAMGVPIEGLDE